MSLQKNLLIALVQLGIQIGCRYQPAPPWNEAIETSLPFENGPVPGRSSIQGRISKSQENSLRVSDCHFDLILVPVSIPSCSQHSFKRHLRTACYVIITVLIIGKKSKTKEALCLEERDGNTKMCAHAIQLNDAVKRI